MNDYQITSDSTVDLGRARMEELGVPYVRLVYIRDGVEKQDGMTDQCALEIYDNMRNGVVYKSAQANPEDFMAFWTPILESGRDILYIGFSSGLSGTVNSAFLARAELGPSIPSGRSISWIRSALRAARGCCSRRPWRRRTRARP